MMEICSCGKILTPVIKNGKQIGVTHSPEDEDWHYQYFGSYQVVFITEQNLDTIQLRRKPQPSPTDQEGEE